MPAVLIVVPVAAGDLDHRFISQLPLRVNEMDVIVGHGFVLMKCSGTFHTIPALEVFCEELQQRVLLLTRAASRVVRAKHLDVTSEAVLNEVRDAVLEQVSFVLDDPSVIVRKQEMYGHVFSWQNVNVYIYDGNKEIYNFQMEV